MLYTWILRELIYMVGVKWCRYRIRWIIYQMPHLARHHWALDVALSSSGDSLLRDAFFIPWGSRVYSVRLPWTSSINNGSTTACRFESVLEVLALPPSQPLDAANTAATPIESDDNLPLHLDIPVVFPPQHVPLHRAPDGVRICDRGYIIYGWGRGGRRVFIRQLLPTPGIVRLSLVSVLLVCGLPFGELVFDWPFPGLHRPDETGQWISMSSKPADVWKRLLRFTTRLVRWVRTLTEPRTRRKKQTRKESEPDHNMNTHK